MHSSKTDAELHQTDQISYKLLESFIFPRDIQSIHQPVACALDYGCPLINMILASPTTKTTATQRAYALLSVVASLCLCTTACAYRFTNQHVSPPPGVRTIAVEAIYDTSREVLPHEMLWESLQSAFASDGHLRLTSQSGADALVRAQIKSASVMPAGGNIANDLNVSDQTTKIKDPKAFSLTSPPPLPNQFRRLTQAGEYQDKATISTVIDVEVWNLNTRALLFKKTYPTSATFQALHANASTTANNNHLRFDEAGRASFKLIADGVANDVVKGLMLR